MIQRDRLIRIDARGRRQSRRPVPGAAHLQLVRLRAARFRIVRRRIRRRIVRILALEHEAIKGIRAVLPARVAAPQRDKAVGRIFEAEIPRLRVDVAKDRILTDRMQDL